MTPIPPISRPVVVCGMARSGTSLVGQLLKTSPDIVVFPELSPASTPAVFDLLTQVRHTIHAQSWRPFSAEDIEARVIELLRRVWGAGRDPDMHDDTGQRRFALKQPHAEDWAEHFHASLPTYPPQWVYTYRNPAAIYDSTLRQAGWGDISPDAFMETFLRSVSTARRLADRGDLFAFDVERATTEKGHRLDQIDGLFSHLELTPTGRTTRFVENWPQVNTSEAQNRGPLTSEEITARVASFRRHLRHRELEELLASLPSD